MIQAGINGNKYDNMNPKTLSEPQNDSQSDTKNDTKKWHQKLKNETLCYWSKLQKWLYGGQ